MFPCFTKPLGGASTKPLGGASQNAWEALIKRFLQTKRTVPDSSINYVIKWFFDIVLEYA